MPDSWINDLRLAATFVRSVETGNHELNFELQLLADRIDALIEEKRVQGVQATSGKGVTEESH
jgi:hypothetical protein